MKKIKDFLAQSTILIVGFFYVFGGFIGLGFAIANDSWQNAILSIIVPFYGLIYSVVCIFS